MANRTGHMNTAPNRPGIDAFHRERSRCVDAFADLEEAVIALLLAHDIKFGGESFGMKLGKLTKLKPSPRLSKTCAARLVDVVNKCAALTALRNDIVHSRLKLATIGEDQKACFINLDQCGAHAQSARLLSLEGLRAVTLESARLAQEARELKG